MLYTYFYFSDDTSAADLSELLVSEEMFFFSCFQNFHFMIAFNILAMMYLGVELTVEHRDKLCVYAFVNSNLILGLGHNLFKLEYP